MATELGNCESALGVPFIFSEPQFLPFGWGKCSVGQRV